MRKFFVRKPTVLFTDHRKDRVEITEYSALTGKVKRVFEMGASQAAQAGYTVPGRTAEVPVPTGIGVGWMIGMAAPVTANGGGTRGRRRGRR